MPIERTIERIERRIQPDDVRHDITAMTREAIDLGIDAGLQPAEIRTLIHNETAATSIRATAKMTGLPYTDPRLLEFDELVTTQTAIKSGAEVLEGAGDYRPTINPDTDDLRRLADLYDALQTIRGDARRCHRGRRTQPVCPACGGPGDHTESDCQYGRTKEITS